MRRWNLTAIQLLLWLAPAPAWADALPGPSCKCAAAQTGSVSLGGALVATLAVLALLTLRLAMQRQRLAPVQAAPPIPPQDLRR